MIQLLYWCVAEIKDLRARMTGILGDIGMIRVLITGIASGSSVQQQQVFTNAGDPNGVITVPHTNPAICIDTVDNIVWTKTDGVASNTGWGSP